MLFHPEYIGVTIQVSLVSPAGASLLEKSRSEGFRRILLGPGKGGGRRRTPEAGAPSRSEDFRLILPGPGVLLRGEAEGFAEDTGEIGRRVEATGIADFRHGQLALVQKVFCVFKALGIKIFHESLAIMSLEKDAECGFVHTHVGSDFLQ